MDLDAYSTHINNMNAGETENFGVGSDNKSVDVRCSELELHLSQAKERHNLLLKEIGKERALVSQLSARNEELEERLVILLS